MMARCSWAFVLWLVLCADAGVAALTDMAHGAHRRRRIPTSDDSADELLCIARHDLSAACELGALQQDAGAAGALPAAPNRSAVRCATMSQLMADCVARQMPPEAAPVDRGSADDLVLLQETRHRHRRSSAAQLRLESRVRAAAVSRGEAARAQQTLLLEAQLDMVQPELD